MRKTIIALMCGEAQWLFASAAPVTAQAQAGKMRAIAVTGLKSYSVFSDLPPVAATVPDFESGSATGFLCPRVRP